MDDVITREDHDAALDEVMDRIDKFDAECHESESTNVEELWKLVYELMRTHGREPAFG